MVKSFVEKYTYPHNNKINFVYINMAVVLLGRFCPCQTIDIHQTLLLPYFGTYLS